MKKKFNLTLIRNIANLVVMGTVAIIDIAITIYGVARVVTRGSEGASSNLSSRCLFIISSLLEAVTPVE